MKNDESEVIADTLNGMVSTFGEMKKEDIPDPVIIFGGWLNENDACLIHAPAGVGKSWFSMSVACSIAGSGGFARWRCDDARDVYYVDGEMGARTLLDMAVTSCGAVRADVGLVDKNLHICTDRGSDDEVMDLCDPIWQSAILDMVYGKNAVIILDNIRTLFFLEDENSAESWGIVNSFIKRLRKIATLILIHHDKKSGGFSGSGAAETLVNTRVQLSAREDTGNLDGCGAVFGVSFEKVRSEVTAAHDYRVIGLHPSNGWVEMSDWANQFEIAVQLARTGNYSSQMALAKEMGVTRSKLSKVLRKFDSGGTVKDLLKVDISDVGMTFPVACL